MWTSPDVIQVILATLTLLLQLLVDFSCLSGSGQDLARWCRPGHILIWCASHLMAGSLDAAVVSGLQIGCVTLGVCFGTNVRHAARCRVETTKWLHRIDCAAEIVLGVTCISSGMSKGHGVGVVRFCSGRFPCLCCAWPFLASSVFFCETLLPGFALPVVVAHPAPVHYQSAPKLPEHGSRRDNSNLA
jgi:hypothetical protein